MSSNDHRRRPHQRAESFRCAHCRLDVSMRAPGTAHRNHCPACLTSKHVDDHRPGDRAAECHARMEPIAITVRGDGEWVLIHRCTGLRRAQRQPHRRRRQPPAAWSASAVQARSAQPPRSRWKSLLGTS